MGKQTVEIEIPDGWEFVRFGQPVAGEYIVSAQSGNVNPFEANGYLADSFGRMIIKKAVQYRDPVLPADAGKAVKFSDDGKTWIDGFIMGWESRSFPWVGTTARFKFCQIAEVPSE
jgi:hypothetical protein